MFQEFRRGASCTLTSGPDIEGQAGARCKNGKMLVEHWDAVEVSLTRAQGLWVVHPQEDRVK